MSRIGKQPVNLSDKVKVSFEGNDVLINGPKGTLRQATHPKVTITEEDGSLTVSVKNPQAKEERALWGLYRSLLANMVQGVTEGFEKKLEIIGVGYRAQVSGKKVVLNLGFSHPVEIDIPEDVSVEVDKNNVVVSGIDKQVVGQLAAKIRASRPPEPYKGKGIRYSDEVVRRKAGKAAKAVGA